MAVKEKSFEGMERESPELAQAVKEWWHSLRRPILLSSKTEGLKLTVRYQEGTTTPKDEIDPQLFHDFGQKILD